MIMGKRRRRGRPGGRRQLRHRRKAPDPRFQGGVKIRRPTGWIWVDLELVETLAGKDADFLASLLEVLNIAFEHRPA